MADKRITDVDFIESLNSDESFFINQNSSLKQIKRSDVVFNIKNGGTGATTVADARNNLGLGNTDGALPVPNGGTGATDAAMARANLGAITMTGELVVLSPNSAWINNLQEANVSGVTNGNVIIVSPEPSIDNYNTYSECNIRCVSQSNGKLVFSCENVPDVSVTMNILILE